MVMQEQSTRQSIEQLLLELHRHQVKLWVDNGRLYSQAPEAGIPPALRAEIAQRKAEMIAFLAEAQSASSHSNGAAAPILPAPRNQPLPLSFAQQRLWFLDQLEGEANPTYLIPAAYRLGGLLRVDLLEQAINIIVQRHESLRTTFVALEGKPIQQIQDSQPLALTFVDLGNLPANIQQATLTQRLQAAVARPFDLTRGPLLRATLYGLGKTEHVLLLTMHHIIADGWSLQRFMHELDQLYTALIGGETPSLPPLPIQYADYALWQRQWLQGERLAAQTSYWQRQLANAPTLLELPTDQPRPASQRFKGRTERFVIDPQLAAQLRALSRQHEATLFMTLLAAFAVQLARYSGQDEVVIGTPIANRNHPDLEALIGFLVNTLALRVDLRATEQPLNFATLLQQIRQTTLAAYAHQELPFEQVIQEVGVARHPSHTPLVQVIFALENSQGAAIRLGDLTIEPLTVETQIAKFDLALVLEESANALAGSIEYNSDLFTPATIQRMIGHFQTLLAGIVENPATPIYQLPLLTECERQQILVDWNATAADYPQAKLVHQLFEEQAARTPDALAVVFATSGNLQPATLTYHELNARANQLARHLQSLGVGPECLVGLCVERSLEMIVGLLGILKAGGAYLPLDPAYPLDRLAFMLQDAAPHMIVTQSQYLHQFSAQVQMLVIDADKALVEQQPTSNLGTNVTPDNLAYVIYTSGSTGQPKGVLLHHAGLSNLAQAQIHMFDVDPDSRVMQFLSPNFDVSLSDIAITLCAGATLVLATHRLQVGEAFAQTLQEQAITHIELTPSVLATINPATVPHLRTLIIGGEASAPELVAQWSQERKFFNVYGLTETTVCTTIMDCATWVDRKQPPPIGRPLANTQVYLLDQQGQPVPVGVTGELYIGGVGVARGYHNRPELTAERFITNPFGAGRLYKTGDLGRWLPDGNIEYLGRSDQQVKLRGFRIELGEIENLLSQHPAIGDAVVLLREDQPDKKQLVAYVVPSDKPSGKMTGWQDFGVSAQSNDDKMTGRSDDVILSSSHPVILSSLRSYLQAKLPHYMLPAAFVLLDALPLTPNGKVDRKALPAPALSPDQAHYVATRTPLEEVLAAIWGEVLDIPQVGVTDNFFDLGGHSLLVTQILARIRSAFQVDLPVRTLFEAATVAELAQIIETARTSQQTQPLPPPIQPVARNRPLPLSFAQQRLWFLAQLEGPSPTYNMPVALRLTGRLQVEPLQSAIDAIVARHEILRTTFGLLAETDREDNLTSNETIAIQQIHPSMSVPLVLVDCQHLAYAEADQHSELQRLLAQAADAPFDLTQGPLLRVNLYRLGQDDHLLLVTMHHIIADGWSLDIWWQELDAFYQAALAGNTAMITATLPPLPIQYADFAVWQRQWLNTPAVQAAQLTYWRQQLAGIPPLLELPTDQPRPPVQTFTGRTESFAIAPDVLDGLYALSRQANASLFMTLLGAFSLLLARYSRQNDFVIGTPIANRQQQEIESLIGFFVNTLPLRMVLSDDLSFFDLLAHVRQVTLDGYAHQALPFEQLVGTLNLPRSLSYPPLFQVMMTHAKRRSSQVVLGNLQATPFELDNVTAKFDLTLYWMEEAHAPENAASLKGAIEYNSDLFSATTIRRMIGHLQQLLRSILAAPKSAINRLPLLTQAEVQQLGQWNNTTQPYPSELCIHQLFEAQVARTPAAVAVVFADGVAGGKGVTLTYAQLNQRANQLAHVLIQAGVAPGHFVGLCLPTSEQLLIGMLAILKAGGAYVPLDEKLPTARLEQIASTGRLQLILTEQRIADRLPPALHCLCLDSLAPQLDQANSSNPVDRVTPHDLIYMIYTSGSTGVPKGAGVYQHSFVNLVHWFVDAYALSQADRVLITSSVSFDLTQKNFFAPLIVGGQLHLNNAAPYEYAAMRQHIAQHQITWLNCAPSAFYPFIDPENSLPHSGKASAATFQPLQSLRYLFLGGEPIATARLQPWLQSPACRVTVVNTYGPTECTDVVAAYTLSAADLATEQAIPIGTAIDNATLHVLDTHQQSVPVGIAGELWIGGVCVGAGYLDDPALTAAKFIHLPLIEQPASAQTSPHHTLYRTGDLVRRRADGSLVFLGRLDHQVKVRGFRIELGEIEATLRRHRLVQEAVVVTYQPTAESTLLVAYVTLDQGEPKIGPNKAATLLRQHLQTQLPDYMIPAAFLVLAQFPLTASGKIDRRQLPPITADVVALATASDAFVAPATANEERLAAIWATLLGVVRVGRHDNFFALGGHSLVAVQLVARIRTLFQIELPVRTIFEAPTLAALAEAVAALAPHGQANAPLAPIPPLPRQPQATDLPLSFGQQRLWFLQRMENAGAAYHIPSAFHITGPLQVVALEQALAEMVRRHEVLRTTFHTVAGTPVQRIHATLTIPLSQIDLQPLPPAAQSAALARWLTAETQAPFDLEQGPMLRVTLYHLQRNAAVLMLNLHHIIADDWSVEIWWRELNALYQAFATGQPSPLPPLPIQYADFADWQRTQLTGDRLQQQLAYWQRQLADAPNLLALPTDRPRPLTQTFNGAVEQFALAPALATALFQRCRELDVTPFMFLYTTFAILLARYSREEDIVIGSPITNRQYTETESLIGFCVNTLALRTDLSGNPSFAALLERVRQTVLDAFTHSEIPFERLVSELHIPRSLNHAPLFQVLFVWQQAHKNSLVFPDLAVTPIELAHTTAKFDLSLYLTEADSNQSNGSHVEPAGIAGALEYNSDLFDQSTMVRLIEQLQTLLAGVVATPNQPIQQLPLLPIEQRRQLLQSWNDTASANPVDQCLHQLFEAQVDRTPNALAIQAADSTLQPATLTYRELNQRANQLAHYLQSVGVGPDKIVGICLERSPAMLIGILGILKAGGAYLPIDPAYPAGRIAFMVSDANVALVLTQQKLVEQLPPTATQLLCWESLQPRVAHHATENLNVAMSTENLLYLLYTSGSTGEPKGVAMPHRPLVNLIQWQLATNQFQRAQSASANRTLQFSPISFDVSCQEIFTTWYEGGTLVLVDEPLRRDPYALLNYLAEQKIGRLFLPFIALQQLAEAAEKRPALVFMLRDVITAGEQLQSTPAIIAWFRRMGATLHNHYGPTETHVITAFTLPAAVEHWPPLPPIGRPLANCKIYLLDAFGEPAPIGVAGELYLGGAGVARGYLDRPTLTQQRFIPNPWATGLLYRSGDLGRYRADGQLEYLGRADNQVKVRGYRIEPGEIEAVLTQHKAVQEAVVMVAGAAGQQRLVAYAVLHPEHDPAATQLQLHEHLRQTLPAYMLPTSLVCLDALPLTPSGKVDRRKLLEIEAVPPMPTENFVSPQTALEKSIAGIWRELLHVPRVGVHDNFFDVGGDSLLVVQVFDRLQQVTDAELSITNLFQYPTIEALAGYLSQPRPLLLGHQENQARANARRDALRQPRRNR